jgi:hypothetical protein
MIPPKAHAERNQNIKSLEDFRNLHRIPRRQRHRDEVIKRLVQCAERSLRHSLVCPVVECNEEVSIPFLLDHLNSHEVLFFRTIFKSMFYTDYLEPYYKSLGVGRILMKLITGEAAEISILCDHGEDVLRRFVWPIGNYLVTPDPIDTIILGDENDLNDFAQHEGLHYDAWWVHPDLQKVAWWNAGGEIFQRRFVVQEDTIEPHHRASVPAKPEGYRSTLMDLEGADLSELERLKAETMERFHQVFGVDPMKINSFIHFPYVEQLSTFHIHFKYKLPDKWSNSSQARISPSLEEVIDNLRMSPSYYRDHRRFDGIGGQPAHILSILNACYRRNDNISDLLDFDRSALVFG